MKRIPIITISISNELLKEVNENYLNRSRGICNAIQSDLILKRTYMNTKDADERVLYLKNKILKLSEEIEHIQKISNQKEYRKAKRILTECSYIFVDDISSKTGTRPGILKELVEYSNYTNEQLEGILEIVNPEGYDAYVRSRKIFDSYEVIIKEEIK